MSVRNILMPYQIANEMPVDLSAFVQASFIDEFPLATRLTRMPIGVNEFDIIAHSPRQRQTALGAGATDVETTLTLDHVATYLQGDVLEIGTERVEINGAITVTNEATGEGTVVVVRGVEGTTAAAHLLGDTVYLIGNSRTGGEVDQEAYRVERRITRQHIQTFQFPIQVAGRTSRLSGHVLPPGGGSSRTPMGGPTLTREEDDKLRDMVKDIESSSLYGLGQSADAGNATKRWKQKGLRKFAELGGNLVTSPTNAAAYKPTDLERDMTQQVADKGGVIDIILCSTNFGLAFSTWGQAAQAVPAGETQFGTPIRSFMTGLFPGIAIWYTRALRPFTAVGLDSRRVRMRHTQGGQEHYKARGSRGDAFEGEWIADMAIEIEDPEQAVAWVEGISNFTPQSGMA